MDKSLYKSDLIDLQDIDIKINSLTNEKESAELVIALKHSEQEYKQLQNELVENEIVLSPYNKKIKELDALMDKYHLSVESNSESMSKTNIPSELTNYLLQEEEIKNNIKNLDKEIDNYNKEFEGSLDRNREISLEIEEIKDQLVTQSKEVIKFWTNLDKKIGVLKADRIKVYNNIPYEYTERYEILRQSEKIVVGYLNEEQCGICGFIFSSNELSKIEQKEKDQCPSCGGILL
jgi:predicted  nucleic acid-binding Zn-ribbon protein